jgi:hypothetical protein
VVDYDHDGTPDVMSLSFGSGNPVRLHLFRGDASGGLGPKRTFETSLANGATPSVRNHNGALEILVSERSGHLAVLRYSNDAVSVSSIAITPDFDLSSVFADLNGDGIEDIIYTAEPEPASETNEPLSVMLANRDGSFAERIPLPRVSEITFPFRAHVSDLDGDGRADIIVSDFHSANLYFFRGDGAGHFEEGRALGTGGPVNTFVVGDVNNDGKPDIVTGNADQTISVLLNRGACTSRRRVANR